MQAGSNGHCSFVPGTNGTKECANANCIVDLPPIRNPTPCEKCRADCLIGFVNPIPGFAINSGLGVTESSIGGTFGGAVKNIGTKVNKVYGAYNLGVCMEDCKKVCNKDTCDQDI
ncbi:MAG: hypothetical protein AB2565_18285 [Candidatus Thiodiazotropha endolucinida]|uniref:hypothetical protein n=1 Tax=Candidatus Thiodiazotropha endolucinida TaxID=1655433 RepID=UPI0012B68ADD|nr:hypothetical protein [Candidatus Thiodiazotropha endolucinida]